MNDTTTLTDVQLMEYAESVNKEVSIDENGDIQLTDAGKEFLETNSISQEDRNKITLLLKDLINNDNQETDTAEAVKALVLGGFGVGDLVDFMLTPAERKRLVTAKVPHDPDCGLFLVRSPAMKAVGSQEIVDTLLSGLRERG